MIRKPEELSLWLPSAFPRHVPCDTKFQEIEWSLRYGQAHDALQELHQALRSRAYMLRFKDRFLRGQGANTRARNCLKSVDVKVDASAEKYRAAHRAMVTLSPLLGKVGWQGTLRSLADEDIRSMTAGTDGQSSEGRRRLSWIWLICSYGDESAMRDDEEDLQDGMSIHSLSRVDLTISCSYPYRVV